jgi:hypothetical protein
MKAYHITATEEAYKSIVKEGKIRAGKNAADKNRPLAHVSLTRPEPNDFLINYWVKGDQDQERWIIEVEIPDTITLEDDPAEKDLYEGGPEDEVDKEVHKANWKVFAGDLPVKVLSVEHVQDLERWNDRELGHYPGRQLEFGEVSDAEVRKSFPKEGSKFR